MIKYFPLKLLNMNKFIVIFTSIQFLICCSLCSQPQYYDSWKDALLPSEANDVKGSPYLFEKWQKGYVYTVAGDSMQTMQINFNGLTGAFEVKEKGRQIQANIKHHNKVKIYGADRNMVFINDHPENNDLDYAELIYNGAKVKLFKSFSVYIREKTASTYNGSSKEKYYSKSTDFYAIKNDQKTEVKRKSKFFEQYFDDKNLKSYIKKNKIDLKNDSDLAKLFEYAESRM